MIKVVKKKLERHLLCGQKSSQKKKKLERHLLCGQKFIQLWVHKANAHKLKMTAILKRVNSY